MTATTFEVHVSIDDWKFLPYPEGGAMGREREQILTSFEASLDHWIAEQQLELRNRT